MAKKEKFAHQLFICGRSMKRDAEGWIWQRGKAGKGVCTGADTGEMLEVVIHASGDSGKNVDFHVTICVAGVLAFEDWKATEERAATWATKKLRALMNVIGGCR